MPSFSVTTSFEAPYFEDVVNGGLFPFKAGFGFSHGNQRIQGTFFIGSTSASFFLPALGNVERNPAFPLPSKNVSPFSPCELEDAAPSCFPLTPFLSHVLGM